MYYKHIISLRYGLSIDIKHVKITWTDTIQAYDKFEHLKFLLYFFNKGTSFNISLICWKFSTLADKGHLEGTVSQKFDLGPTF